MKNSDVLFKAQKLLAILMRYPGVVDNLRPKIGVRVESRVSRALCSADLIACLRDQGVVCSKEDYRWARKFSRDDQVRSPLADLIRVCHSYLGLVNVDGKHFGSKPIKKLIRRIDPLIRPGRSWKENRPRRMGPQPMTI